MRTMRGFISKAFVLAVEGDICGFSSSLFLSPSIFPVRRLPMFPGIFQSQPTGWSVSSRALLKPTFYDAIRNNEESESATRISYLVSFLIRIMSAETSVVHAIQTADDLVRTGQKNSDHLDWSRHPITDDSHCAAVGEFLAILAYKFFARRSLRETHDI